MAQNKKQILLISATEDELEGLVIEKFANVEIRTLVTGVGMVATTFSLTRELLSESVDLVVNIGIAGAFDDTFEIGEVVQVTTDRLVEMGVEDREIFIEADVLGLVDTKDMMFVSDIPVNDLPVASGITVNKVHGNTESIQRTVEQFNPDVESMEGAAVGYVCWKMGVPWVQIRGISNVVEPRNRETWNIPLAMNNLHIEVNRLLSKFDNEA